MAMNGDNMGTEIKNAVDAFISGLSESEKRNMSESQRLEMYKEMANAIVDHLTNNVIVSTTVTGTLPNGPVAASGIGDIT